MKKELLKKIEEIRVKAEESIKDLPEDRVKIGKELAKAHLYALKDGCQIRAPFSKSYNGGILKGSYDTLERIALFLNIDIDVFIDLEFVNFIKEILEDEESIVEEKGIDTYNLFEDEKSKENAKCFAVDLELKRVWYTENGETIY